MSPSQRLLEIYLRLAHIAGQRQRPQVRARLLVLAAIQALDARLVVIAEQCRAEVLRHNPHHLLRRWPTLRLATADADFQTFLTQVARQYPPERAELLLQSMQADPAEALPAEWLPIERAATLLGCDWRELQQRFGEADRA